MKLNESCLPCIVNQAVRVARMTDAPNREELYRSLFERLARVDFSLTAPELCGEIYAMIKAQVGLEDPYREVRRGCNTLMLGLLPRLREKLAASSAPFEEAVKYAILGNIIDFSAPGELTEQEILRCFEEGRELGRNDIPKLKEACLQARELLYLGDNCGEVAADVLLLEEIHRLNPSLKLCYVVKGAPVVNDVILSDALECGIDRLAEVMDNGDDSQGTALERVSGDFLRRYHSADVVIAKGQGNFESLSEDHRENVYCLLMAKCAHIAGAAQVKQGSLAAFRLE